MTQANKIFSRSYLFDTKFLHVTRKKFLNNSTTEIGISVSFRQTNKSFQNHFQNKTGLTD
jgi:hypothetical protein